ncbi:MAG: secretin N-terminal domain-containing protein, partial [Anaerolineae bacterium]
QILRIHNLKLLEEDNNLIITKSQDVNQIPAIVSGDTPDAKSAAAAIVTRVFRVKNGNPNTISAIIRPMMSQGALVEIANETRQLIVTDITTNVDKIAALLSSLDAPHSPLEIETYVAKNISSTELIELATKIITPFTEGNPLILVPQLDSNTIFIVSTPYLIERTLAVMEDLDAPFKIGQPTGNENIFLYKVQHRNPGIILSSIHELSSDLKAKGNPPGRLLNALENVQFLEDANSLLFQGDSDTLGKIKEILATLDSPPEAEMEVSASMSEIFLYKPKYATKEQIQEALQQLSLSLDRANPADQKLAKAIQTMKWISESDSFLFKSDSKTIAKLKDLLTSLDSPEGIATSGAYTFFLYKLKFAQGDEVKARLENISHHMKQSGTANAALTKTIDTMKWIKETNSLLINGPANAVEQVTELVSEFDVPPGLRGGGAKTAFFIYKPVHRSAAEIQTALSDMAQDLQESGLIDPDLLQTISSIRYVKATNSLLFTGTSESLEKVKELLGRIDVSTGKGAPIQQLGALTFMIYKPQYIPAAQLMSHLKAVASHLDLSNPVDKDLVNTINTMKWIQETNSILFTGSTEALQKLEGLLEKFDIPGAGPKEELVREGANVFIIYKPKYQSGPELISILHDFDQNLIQSGVVDKNLSDTINNLKWIEKTSTLLISGDQESVNKVQNLLERFDVPGKENMVPSIEAIDNTSFLIYKLQYHPGEEIVSALKQISVDLVKSSEGKVQNQNLLDAINSLQWIKVTNSLLGTGEQSTLTKLKELISNLDVPLRKVLIEVLKI